MNDFDDVQQKAQEMTANVTDGSPAHTVDVQKQTVNEDGSFSYAGYGPQESEKTKTAGRTTVVENPTANTFATPYRGGGSYPGAVLYNAEVHPDQNVASLKSKYSPVTPYTLSFRGMTGEVDTLNIRKAFAELADQYVPHGIDWGYWTGYDMQTKPPHEDFVHGFVRNLWNWIPQLGSNVFIGSAGGLTAGITGLYGKIFNDQDAIRAANNILKLTDKWIDDVSYALSWDYKGEQNKAGSITGSIVGSMGVNLFGGIRAALTLSGAEGIAGGIYARRMAQDRGMSTTSAMGIGFVAGIGVFALGASSRGVEGLTKSLFVPTAGWGMALKNSPKSFVIRKFGEKSLTGLYDSMTESGQDLLTNWLGNGELKGEDWEEAWLTFVYGAAVAGLFSAVAVHADKKAQAQKNEYTAKIVEVFDKSKDILEQIKEKSHGIITQETIDAYREQLLSGEAREGFIEFVKNRVAENIDRLDSLPDDMKARLKDVLNAQDGATPLAEEMAQLDANIDNMLDNVTGLSDSSKQMAREFLRGMASNAYVYQNVAPSAFKFPTVVADVETPIKTKSLPEASEKEVGNVYEYNGAFYRCVATESGYQWQKTDVKTSTYYDRETKEVHVLREDTANQTDLYPLSTKSKMTETDENAKVSAKAKEEAIAAAKASEDATFDKSRGRALMAHELWHWVEDDTGLPNVEPFVKAMTDWANTVLPNIMSNKSSESVVVVNPSRMMLDTSIEGGEAQKVEYTKETPKEGLERSEAYAYALQYAKSLKGPLGLVGDVRMYMELFNSISQANSVSEKYEAYNKMLSQIIKQNAGIVDDLLKAYPNLRENLKYYVDTGNVGVMKQEDLAKLREVLMSVVDSKTAEKLKSSIGDISVIQTFMDRYEKEYEEAEKADAAKVSKIKQAIYAERQKRTKAISDMGLDLQKVLERQAMQPLALPGPGGETKAIEAPEQQKKLGAPEETKLLSAPTEEMPEISEEDIQVPSGDYPGRENAIEETQKDIDELNNYLLHSDPYTTPTLSDRVRKDAADYWMKNHPEEANYEGSGTTTEQTLTEYLAHLESLVKGPEEPPFRQYSGEFVPLGEGRTEENAQDIELWLNGKKLTPEQYDEIVKTFSDQVKDLVGMKPVRKGKYKLRQNESLNKTQGVFTAEWTPSPAVLKQLGFVEKPSPTVLAAVGRWSAMQDVNKVYSIADDITAITGLGGQGAEDLIVGTTGDAQAQVFVDNIKDITNSLRNLSADLNHSGFTLSLDDINRETPLLEEAINLTRYNTSDIEDPQAKAAVEKFINQIDVDYLGERLQELNYQRYMYGVQEDTKKTAMYLPNAHPFATKFVSTGGWYATTDKETGKQTYKEEKVAVRQRPINAARKYNATDLMYWLRRAGIDTDKFPSVEALEGYIKKMGLEPISFNLDAVVLKDGENVVQVPAFLKTNTLNDPGKINPLYARNEPVTVDYDIDSFLRLNEGHPTKTALVKRLLDQAWAQLPKNRALSPEDMLIEYAAIGRAQMIADYVFSQYNNMLSKFNEWATVGPKGEAINGADIDFIKGPNGIPYVEKLNAKNKEESPYVLRKDLHPKRMPVGLQFLTTYAHGWRPAVITQVASIKTTDGNVPVYVVRFKLGQQFLDMTWDYREFELLQKNDALFARPDLMSGKEFERYASDGNFPLTMDVAFVNPTEKAPEFVENPVNYTARVRDAKRRKNEILNLAGMSVYDPTTTDPNERLSTDLNLTGKVFSVSDDVDYVIDGTDVINVNDDPFPYLTNEQFENVDPINPNPQKTITGKEASNREVYNKMKDAEENSKTRMNDYLNKNVFGLPGGKLGAINALIEKIQSKKHSAIVGAFTIGSGIQSQSEYIFDADFAKKLNLNLTAEEAERTVEQYRRDIEKALLKNTFKTQKELGKWQIRNSVDIDGVKAKIYDSARDKVSEKSISKDEIISLYLADITKTGDYVSKTGRGIKLSVINGGYIESNGYTYVYNKLHNKYRNFDELVGLLTEQDKQVAEILADHLSRSAATITGGPTGDFFIPVNTHNDYEIDGWSNRRRHNSSVFGTRLLNPDVDLVVTGAFATAYNMAATAGVRVHNYLDAVQTLNDLFNMASLLEEKVRIDRGFQQNLRKDEAIGLDEEAELRKVAEASRLLNEALYDAVGPTVGKEYKNAIKDALTNDNGTEVWSGFKWMQKITRTASAMVLSLKPRQAATNLTGNYLVFGGLSSHNMLRYSTVDFMNAFVHGVEAWKDMKNNKTFMHRLEQSALSEQYKRAIDNDESILQELGKVAASHGKSKTADAAAAMDALAKWSTKWGVGSTNTFFDLLGIALARWNVKADVMKNIAAETGIKNEAKLEEMTENQMADYMFSHISSSNIMARGRFSKGLSRYGLEGLAAFKNDLLQKSAAMANAFGRFVNSKDKNVRTQAVREMEAIIASNISYVAIQAGLVYALVRALTGDDLSDKEEEYLVESLLRESIAQVTDLFPGGAYTQQMVESLVLGKEGGSDFIPVSNIKRVNRNLRKGDYISAGAELGSLAGFAPLERAVQMTRASAMALGDDERAAAVGRLMIAGRGESTAMNMLGYTKNKSGQIVPKKTKKKKE